MMKAYIVSDKDNENIAVVFAETRGKAISRALGTDEFPQSDYDYTWLCARRFPKLDEYYHGHDFMDFWDCPEDRVALVRFGIMRCDKEYIDEQDCINCPAKAFCEEDYDA